MGYKLTELAKQEVCPVEVCSATLSRKIEEKRERDRRANPYLAENFAKMSFRPEVAQVLQHLSPNSPNRMLYDEVAEKRYYLKRDINTGRLFHPVVNLPNREHHLRDYLLFDSVPAVEIDVGSAQPALFACFYQSDSSERARFIEYIRNDEVYSFAMKQLGVTRDVAKIEFLRQCAYGPIQKHYPLFEKFCEWLPELGSILTSKRLELGSSGFSREMQRREADIVIGKVLPDCQREGLTVLPIHDALLCKQSEKEKAQDIMLHHWKDTLGFEPIIRCKEGIRTKSPQIESRDVLLVA